MDLREALEQAHEAVTNDEARMLIKALLDQKVEKYGTLIDECEVVIFG